MIITAKGEPKTASLKEAEKFNERIQACLEGRLEVSTHMEETIIKSKDVDDITTKQEISLDFENKLGVGDRSLHILFHKKFC